MRSYAKSAELYARACKCLAGGVASEFRKFSYPHPLFYSHGSGSRIVDVDGNDYLDFTLSQGPLILGHNHPHVMGRVACASSAGQLFAGQHMLELDLAEKLQCVIPCAEIMRFSLSGSEAVHAALRTARAVTGRPRFLRFEGHYHGWLDNVAFGIGGSPEEALGPREHPTPMPWTAGLPRGIMDEALVLPWNDAALLEKTLDRHSSEIAAIITEPVMCNSGCIPPEPGYLETLRRLCDQYGIALIFDEVITGFRVGMGGAQSLFGVTPDLAIFGKALASGYPLSVLAGRERWMRPIAEGTVVHAGTMNSGVSSVAAAVGTLEVLEKDGSHERLFELGRRLMEGLTRVAADAGSTLRVQGLGPMFQAGFTSLRYVRDYRESLSYNRPQYARFVAGMQEHGIRLIGRGLWYISGAHTVAEIDQAVDAAAMVLADIGP